MNWSGFKFLTDENIDKEVVALLRSLSMDVFDIKEQELWGLPDIAILQKSVLEQRIIITQDSDFGTLIYRDALDFYGLIYLRPGHDALLHIQTLRTVFQQPIEIQIPFILVAENMNAQVKIRIRQF
ncbi:MAG: hypothetical protein RLZZ292_3143 [Bacteroidota bacterium]|jgi:predicted nuclease of predicted toxin-antitoxin system